MKKFYSNIIYALTAISIISSIILIATGIFNITSDHMVTGIASILCGVIVFAVTILQTRKRLQSLKQFLSNIDSDGMTVQGSLDVFPIPVAIMHIDGSIIWYNDKFSSLVNAESLYAHSLEDIIPAIKWGDILKSGDKIEKTISINNKNYLVSGCISIDDSVKSDSNKYTVYLFFNDKSKETELETKYFGERTDICIISIDNYDYISQKAEESENQNPFYKLNRLINEWAHISEGIIKKIDRDKYFIIFEHKYLNNYIDEKFQIINQVRSLAEEMHIPMSVSIGVGSGGNLIENESSARNALELAIGRGGDQAAVKDESQYRFYGGKSREYEKSTKLKTRAVASALIDFISGVNNVVIMGHSGLDYDAFGAAIGLHRAISSMNKESYIICDSKNSIERIYNEINSSNEYEGVIISPTDAESIVDSNTLLIIVDTHRPSLLPNKHLLSLTDKTVLIDHHRRATEFIDSASLVYLEPYASSACEMVTELLQYFPNVKLSSLEAECLYMGIIMDTKNFLLKTGVRTFEAASYLRQCGIDTINIKKLFTIDINEYISRSIIVCSAKLVSNNIAISTCTETSDNIRITAAQAADEMLNIANVEASFVLYPISDTTTGISGRSLGNVNVQLILENLGGGGHQSVAGAQYTGNCEAALKALENAIKLYMSESADSANEKQN